MTLTIQAGQFFSSELRNGLHLPTIKPKNNSTRSEFSLQQSILQPIKAERSSYNDLLNFFKWRYGPLRFKPVSEEPLPRIADFEIELKEDVYKYADLINDILKNSELSSISQIEKLNGKMILKINSPKKKMDNFFPEAAVFSLEFNEKCLFGETKTSTIITCGIEKNNNFYPEENLTFEHSNLSISRINCYIGAFLELKEVRDFLKQTILSICNP